MAMEEMQSRGDLLPGRGWRLAVVCVVLVYFQAAAVYCIQADAFWVAVAIVIAQITLFAPAAVCYWKTKDFNPAFLYQHSINECFIGLACFFLPELKALPRQEKFERIAAFAREAECKRSLYQPGVFTWSWWINVAYTVGFVWAALTLLDLPPSILLDITLGVVLIPLGGGSYFLDGVVGFFVIKHLIRGGKSH